MRFGVREICDVVFKAKSTVTIGSKTFKKGQPVLYIDSAKTSTIEGAATTVYATGGRGNARLISWEGEKTLTFTVEDALLSPIGFAVLSGAGLFDEWEENDKVHVHTTCAGIVEKDASNNLVIDITDALDSDEQICADAPLFVIVADTDGSLKGQIVEISKVDSQAYQAANTTTTPATEEKPASHVLTLSKETGDNAGIDAGTQVFCDFYVLKAGSAVSELQIDAANFAGTYYVEASTLFRRQIDGKDLPAEITFPNVKIQSNFTFTMASTGDPSTFTFTMDAMPGYTYFDRTKKVLCVMQIVGDTIKGAAAGGPVMEHVANGNTVDKAAHLAKKSDEDYIEDSYTVGDAE